MVDNVFEFLCGLCVAFLPSLTRFDLIFQMRERSYSVLGWSLWLRGWLRGWLGGPTQAMAKHHECLQLGAKQLQIPDCYPRTSRTSANTLHGAYIPWRMHEVWGVPTLMPINSSVCQ